VAEPEAEAKLPTFFGRWLSPVLGFLADVGGTIGLAVLVYAGLEWIGVF